MTPTEAIVLPTGRPTPFDPPAELGELRESRPITPLAYPDGHQGWLVTSHALVREVLADRRFSARSELRHLPVDSGGQAGQPAPPGMFISTDPPVHTRYRHLLTGEFTVRRMRRLAERIEEITRVHLDAMERQGPPADLVAAFTAPIPAVVICELLGVPEQDRERFMAQGTTLMRTDVPHEEKIAAYLAMQAHMKELVLARRAAPTDDMLSGLTRSDLTDEELANIGFMLLGAGLDTTANMLALGTFALLRNPAQLAVLRSEPGGVDQVVEELLRYLSVVPFLVRTALEDVELGGERVGAGETVTISIAAANRDPGRFADPDRLDLVRASGGHVAFGHGVHQCLGQQLARVEMRAGFSALFERFPSLRLAVEPGEVPLRTDMLIYGVHRLPVTWDTGQ
ncbi:cytochrome P450 [Nonomuraea thailandensis]|uniref:Cytochrome P450 n=1 Tax=Nonomuraea thailandensis TaxID=1188745 RepID=A0A9X2K3W4_9ACTN|nr:cytochrome P450 [Nonomuraea thailandensis]MCP2358615.1 cytochrome P450 [Nonomuraea thailandensis]